MSIKVYIACLSSYNSGYLYGQWLDLDDYSSGDEVLSDIEEKILKNPENPMRVKYNEDPEEWAMHDIEGVDCQTEWPNFDELIEINELLNEKNGEIILAYKEHNGIDSIWEAKRQFEDAHDGKFDSVEDLAWHYAENVEGWDLSEGIGRYFDAKSYGRDLECNGHYEIDGHWFRPL